MSAPIILVTGANGFVAGHLIKTLLEAGFSVRGSVRSPSSAKKVTDAFTSFGDRVTTTIVPDITKPESYEHAFAGNITGIIHAASPFTFTVTDAKKDLLDPAMAGATAILEATQRYAEGKVTRIVNVGSFAGIKDLSKGLWKGHTYTAEQWNPMTYEQAAIASGVEAYCASKGLAERAMLEWMESNKPSFDVAYMNPAWVFGPHYPPLKSAKNLNESTHKLAEMLGAEDVHPFDFGGFCDVRTLARACVEGIKRKEAGGKRYLLATHFDWQAARDGAVELAPELEGRLPRGTPGHDLVEESYVVDGTPATKELGIEYVPLNKCMADSYREILEGQRLDAAASA